MKTFLTRITGAALAVLPAVMAAAADAPRRFAAPEVASAPAAGGSTGIGQVMLALVIVLVAVFAAALLMKRLRGFTTGGANGIEVVAQASLGSKERVVIVKVSGQRLLLGVAGGGVTLLQTLPPEADAPAASGSMVALQPQRFAELLRRSLGK